MVYYEEREKSTYRRGLGGWVSQAQDFHPENQGSYHIYKAEVKVDFFC